MLVCDGNKFFWLTIAYAASETAPDIWTALLQGDRRLSTM